LRWEVHENGTPGNLGNIAMTVSLYVDGNQIRNVPVSGRVSVTTTVVKTARRISKGEIISRHDLRTVTEKGTGKMGDLIADPEDAVGKMTSRSLRSGQVLTYSMLDNPPVVKKGNRVVVMAENEFIKITTMGKALQDGRTGEFIKVKNETSGKILHSRVSGPGMVKVVF
jgi:flagella basal body P-ring formation protein FlgA